jgi:hypothetical protein
VFCSKLPEARICFTAITFQFSFISALSPTPKIKCGGLELNEARQILVYAGDLN